MDAITYLKIDNRRLTEQLLLAQTVAEQAQQDLRLALERLKAAEEDNRALRSKATIKTSKITLLGRENGL